MLCYAQIWREGQLTAEYKRMPVKTRLNNLVCMQRRGILCSGKLHWMRD